MSFTNEYGDRPSDAPISMDLSGASASLPSGFAG
ncbi:MAG: hypothetical protein K0S65_4856, partial [Labilithrix sp.]|nr:hypothetical protein [Labilithrix sp.]